MQEKWTMSFFETLTSQLTHSQRILVLAIIILLTHQVTSISNYTTLYIHIHVFNTQWNSPDWLICKVNNSVVYCIHTAPCIQLVSKMGKVLIPSFSLEDREARKNLLLTIYSNSAYSLLSRCVAQCTFSAENQFFVMVLLHSELCYFTVETLFVR